MARAVSMTITLDRAKINTVVGDIADDAAYRAAQVARTRMRGNIQSAGLVNSGRLLNSVEIQSTSGDPLRPSYAVGSPLEYAKYLEHGTRGHGPVRAKVLRFKPKGSSTFVFAKWVRGVRAYQFVRQTVREMSLSDYL